LHTIEPFYNWRHLYIASEDKASPFYGRVYSEFTFSQKIYNYFIHPQWDEFGAQTIYLKVIFVDYKNGYAFIELIGEWNDAVHNDIMFLKRNIIDVMLEQGIKKFVLIAENILNFIGEDDDYYQEWYEDVLEHDGWTVFLNLREHVVEEMKQINVQHYIFLGDNYNLSNWRTFAPHHIVQLIEDRLIIGIE